MKSLPLVCAGAVVLGLGMVPSPAQSQNILVITSPRNGAVLPMQNQAEIEAQFRPRVDLETTSLEARVEARRGNERIVVAEGDIRAFDFPDRLRVLWNLANVRPGPYLITVTARAGDRIVQAVRRVTVHPIPKVSVRLTSWRKQGNGARVDFSARARSPAGAAIREFIWTPGDGSAPRRTKTGSFSHVYAARGTSYIVWLEVNDARGGSTLIARDLNLPRERAGKRTDGDEEIFQTTDDCGCEAMTVLVPNIVPAPSSSAYCAPAVPAAPGCAGVANPAPPNNCPAGQVAFKCQLGRITPAPPAQPNLGWSFEIVAKLAARTNDPAQCIQGQYARATRLRDNAPLRNPPADALPPAGQMTLPDGAAGTPDFTFNVVGRPNRYPPAGGPDYGADDYVITRNVKRHSAGGFRWLDMPQGPVGVNSRSVDEEYIAFVQGSLGTCWCRFSIKQNWTAAGGVQGPGLGLIDSHNCRIFNPTQ